MEAFLNKKRPSKGFFSVINNYFNVYKGKMQIVYL